MLNVTYKQERFYSHFPDLSESVNLRWNMLDLLQQYWF